jgi:hypothetical protein
MNTEETSKILAYIAAVEHTREFGEFEFKVWHDLLEDLDFEDATEGVRAYFKSGQTYPIKPGNIIEHARAARTRRTGRQNEALRKRIVELGGEVPTYWNGEPVNSFELASIGAMIEANSPYADEAVRDLIAKQRQHREAIAEGDKWAAEHAAELGLKQVKSA